MSVCLLTHVHASLHWTSLKWCAWGREIHFSKLHNINPLVYLVWSFVLQIQAYTHIRWNWIWPIHVRICDVCACIFWKFFCKNYFRCQHFMVYNFINKKITNLIFDTDKHTRIRMNMCSRFIRGNKDEIMQRIYNKFYLFSRILRNIVKQFTFDLM